MAHSTFLLQPVGPKAGTPGTVAPSSPQDSAPPSGKEQSPQSTLFMLLPMLAIVAFMMFSGRNQKKREAETRAKLKKGDKVLSQSGLIGELVDMDDKVAKVKIAPGTNVQMLISTVAPYVESAATASAGDKNLKDLKDAKAAAEKKG